MGKVIDFVKYKERVKPNHSGRMDGVIMEAVPPYIVFKHYENGVMRKQCCLMSEYMLRELLDSLPC